MSSPVLARHKFEVQVGIEVDDITSVYEGGVPSSVCVNSAASDEWRPLHKATEGAFHPVIFYDKHPQIGCAWAKLPNGYVLARAILWREDPKAKWTQYGWPYYNDQIFGGFLSNWMHSQGIQAKGRGERWISKPFTIKGYNVPEFNRVFCPVPYLDNLDTLWVKYDDMTQEFLFSGKREDGMYICDGSSHCGYITSLSPTMFTQRGE